MANLAQLGYACPLCRGTTWYDADTGKCVRCGGIVWRGQRTREEEQAAGSTSSAEGAEAADLFGSLPSPPLSVPITHVPEIVVRRGSKKAAVLEELIRAANGKTYTETYEGVAYVFDEGWVPSTVLAELAGWRYGARLDDLKQDGAIVHESRHVAGSLWGYRATRIQARLTDDQAA